MTTNLVGRVERLERASPPGSDMEQFAKTLTDEELEHLIAEARKLLQTDPTAGDADPTPSYVERLRAYIKQRRADHGQSKGVN